LGAIAIGWVPLIVLSSAGDFLFRTHSTPSLLHDAGAHARYLFAAPLLIVAELQCGERLSGIIGNFAAADLVRDEDRARFKAMVGSARNLINSRSAEAAVIIVAIAAVAAAAESFPLDHLPAWHRRLDTRAFSQAGWWHVLVSLPLLVILTLGWAWRYIVWARLLWQVSRLKLRLIASHPDRCAGLIFLGQSLNAFAPVALALAAIAAGRSANIVLAAGVLPSANIRFNAVLLAALVLLFAAPLSVFGPTLLSVWRSETFRYGALATRIGSIFERKWLQDPPQSATVLEKPDFSATTDLYGIVANVYALRIVPVDLKSALTLVSVILLPFVPVVLLAVPTDTLWADLKSLLF
jgi:hypothetical protein